MLGALQANILALVAKAEGKKVDRAAFAKRGALEDFKDKGKPAVPAAPRPAFR